MKKILTFAAVISALAFTFSSCGGSEESNTKTIKAEQVKFEYGELAKYLEVANKEATLSWSEDEHSQSFKLEVELKLKKEVRMIEGLDAYDFDFIRLLCVANIELLNDKGEEVIDLSIDDSLPLKELLLGKAGDTKVIVFEGKFHNSEDAPGWFKNSVKFKPGGTADIQLN